jgi:predicted amidophosphoribosyltransferase
MLEDGRCPNWLCRDPERQIARISAIAYSSGPLRKTILRYKYEGATGWQLIFGRLLLGWLEQHTAHSGPDLILANPTFVGKDGKAFAHTEAVLDVAEREDVLGRWPFDVTDPRAIIKTRETTKSAGNAASAKRAAASELRQALTITDRTRTAGRRILVYDDVCTTGSQLDTVARCLVEDGDASHVEAVVLARAPWRPR